MRILMISEHYPPAVNGYAIQCAATAGLLRKRGHEVSVLTSSDSLNPSGENSSVLRLLKRSPLEGYHSLRLPYVLRQFRRRGIFRSNCSIARAVAQSFQPQVVMVWQFNGFGIGMLQGVQRLGIPMVFNLQDGSLCGWMMALRKDPNLFLRLARRWLYGINGHYLDISCLIIASEELKGYYAQQGFGERQMTVMHNGIDSRYVAEQPAKLGLGNRLLYTGRIVPEKGVDIAIKVLAILNSEKKGQFTLDIVGTGPAEYVHQLKDLGERLNLGESLRFLGPKDWEDVMALYQDYDLLLFPSVWLEPFGLTMIEAMARGVPVIAADRGGPKDIISHMVDGLLVEPEKPEAFAEGVRVLADRADLRKRMTERAIRKVKEQFTLEKHVALTEEMLLRVIDQNKPKHFRGSGLGRYQHRRLSSVPYSPIPRRGAKRDEK